MQTNTNLDRAGVARLVAGIFDSGKPEVYLRHALMGLEWTDFGSAGAINSFIDAAIGADKKSVGFAIWYPDTKGHVEKRTAGPHAIKSEGHLVRHTISGWGIIYLQLNFDKLPLINCCVSSNSKKKAENWFGSHRNLKDPGLWDWDAVEKHCARLMRFAESLSQNHPSAKKH